MTSNPEQPTELPHSHVETNMESTVQFALPKLNSLQRLIDFIGQDCRTQPEKYLEESQVQQDGE